MTALIRDRFTRETEQLNLQRVELRDIGGRKGQLFHRPGLLGAVQAAEIRQVLSEGEQTALGMAGFFTEVVFNVSKSAVVLDDPVTSLDHVRREHVARRLADFATERQVIVFTHDIAFVGDLQKAAIANGISLTERSVERRGDRTPGIPKDQHPWKLKTVNARLETLRADLQNIKREREGWSSEVYEQRVANWAGSLSETWERLIAAGIADRLVDRGTQEVRSKMMRLLVHITETDDREFQDSYSRCSRWAKRHDKSPAINYVPPEPAEMEKELERVKSWWDRVRKYDAE